jgi:hypothetical protein
MFLLVLGFEGLAATHIEEVGCSGVSTVVLHSRSTQFEPMR